MTQHWRAVLVQELHATVDCARHSGALLLHLETVSPRIHGAYSNRIFQISRVVHESWRGLCTTARSSIAGKQASKSLKSRNSAEPSAWNSTIHASSHVYGMPRLDRLSKFAILAYWARHYTAALQHAVHDDVLL